MASLQRGNSSGLDRQSTVPPDDPSVKMTNPTPPGPIGEMLSAAGGAQRPTIDKTYRVRRRRAWIFV